MIYLSKRRYMRKGLIAIVVASVLFLVGALALNKFYFHVDILNKVLKIALINMVIIVCFIVLFVILRYKGIKALFLRERLMCSIEENLIAIGAFEKRENKNYYLLPKICLENEQIRISLTNLKIRGLIEHYIDTFSTALPNEYIVEDYYITPNQSELVIVYENVNGFIPEEYGIDDYINLIEKQKPEAIYFDRKHVVDMNSYPHFLISGSTGSGKSYLVDQIIIQAIIKDWDVVILDVKRSYGLFRNHIDYVFEPEDILDKLLQVEREMYQRIEMLQEAMEHDPNVLAVDIGYKHKLIVIEEYIALQGAMEKKKKDELERAVRTISVLARQSCIHLMIVLQSAGTENIQASTRNNLTKVLLGNVQSNILIATFGNGVDIPHIRSYMNKGEGLIQLDRITMLKVPKVTGLDGFEEAIVGGAERQP